MIRKNHLHNNDDDDESQSDDPTALNELTFNRQEIELVICSLANYLHLMRDHRRSILSFLYNARRLRIFKHKENRLISLLRSFFDLVEQLQIFLDMFDVEYKSLLDSQHEMEQGEAYTLWHDICDTLDSASQVHKSLSKTYHALDKYARSFTLVDKRACMDLAKHDLEQLKKDLSSAISINKSTITKVAPTVQTLFTNCNSELIVVSKKLDVVVHAFTQS